MENQQQQSASAPAKLNRTTSMDSEPKTLTKEQYDLAIRAAATMQAFEQRNNETTGIPRAEENQISSLMKDHVASNGCGKKLPA